MPRHKRKTRHESAKPFALAQAQVAQEIEQCEEAFDQALSAAETMLLEAASPEDASLCLETTKELRLLIRPLQRRLDTWP